MAEVTELKMLNHVPEYLKKEPLISQNTSSTTANTNAQWPPEMIAALSAIRENRTLPCGRFGGAP